MSEQIVHRKYPSKSARRGLSLDILWPLVILAGFLFFVSLIPLPPNDFWWHLKIGQYIYTQHSIPTTNMYAWSLPADQPFFYAAWLSELLFYVFYRLGSLALVISLRTILIGISLCVLAVEIRSQSKSWRITALVMAILCLMITNNLPVRTQMFAWIPFVVTYLLYKRFTDGRIKYYWLILCPLAMIWWVNVHGSFILGLVIPAGFLLGEAIRFWLKQEHALSVKQIAWIASSGALSALAVLLNPRMGGIVTYTIKLLTDPPSQQLIEEWQSPTPMGIANISFFLSILFLIVLLATSRVQLSPSEIILTLGFLWLAWSGQRYVIWYGMIASPILGRLLGGLSTRLRLLDPPKNWLNLVLALLLFVPAVAVQPWFVEQLPLPNTYWQQVVRGAPGLPLISVHTPVMAASYLAQHPGGELYNEMGYGSYLIWAIPEQKVFIDPRVELFPYTQWMDYIHINTARNYDAVLNRYGVDRILLDKALQSDLAQELATDHRWFLEYNDPTAQIWSKVTSP